MIAVFVMLLSMLLMEHRPEVVPEFYFAERTGDADRHPADDIPVLGLDRAGTAFVPDRT